MKIPATDWRKYIDRLSKLSGRAAEEMRAYIDAHGLDDRNALIDYAYGLTTKYGEGAGAMAAEMYDAVSEVSRANVPAAVVADTPRYGEVAKTVHGVLKQSQNPDMLSNSVGRLVKRTGADTTLKNALRDGAQFAWIPNGDTCAFCITLASRGWQYMSKKALKNGHAEHIHANCDCTYAIRHDTRSSVEGYDPARYRKIYGGADGKTPQERVNAIRRNMYAAAPEKYREQKRAAYATKKNDVRHTGDFGNRYGKNNLTQVERSAIINTSKYVYTGGRRNESPLTDVQYREAEEAARQQGFNGSAEYSETQLTSIINFPNEDGTRDEKSCLLVIGTDAYPLPDGETPNERLTLNCCMAHEIVGHHEAWLKYKEQEDPLLEEVQASLRASFFGVNLTDYERQLLYEDAMERLGKNNIKYEDIKDDLDIMER